MTFFSPLLCTYYTYVSDKQKIRDGWIWVEWMTRSTDGADTDGLFCSYASGENHFSAVVRLFPSFSLPRSLRPSQSNKISFYQAKSCRACQCHACRPPLDPSKDYQIYERIGCY